MNNRELYDFFQEYLRPATYPVAVKLSKEEMLPPKVRNATQVNGYRLAVCQAIALARRAGRTLGFTVKDHGCALSHILMGLKEEPDFALEGHLCYPLYTKTKEGGIRMRDAECRLDVGTFKTLIVAPLHRADFEPDIIIIYGNPAQIIRLINGDIFAEGGAFTASFMGRGACAAYISYPVKHKKCNLVIPGGGERVFASTTDDEMAFAIPKERIQAVVEGVKGTHDSGAARIPTPFFGVAISAKYPPHYDELERYVGLRTDSAD